MMTEYLKEKGEAYDKKIRARLRLKVKESDVSIKTIAESIEKSPPSVYRYLSLKNKSRLPIEIIVKILAAIGVNEAEFFKEVDEMDWFFLQISFHDMINYMIIEDVELQNDNKLKYNIIKHY